MVLGSLLKQIQRNYKDANANSIESLHLFCPTLNLA
jgi:hypothetical protein